MIRIIKLGDLIYENIEPKYIDENGKEVWNVPNDPDQLKQAMVDTLKWLTDRYFYNEAKKRGDYINMGEIVYDASQGDPDAEFLKALYDAIWEKEEELEAQLEGMSLEQLLELDLEAWARSAYDQVKANLEQQMSQNE